MQPNIYLTEMEMKRHLARLHAQEQTPRAGNEESKRRDEGRAIVSLRLGRLSLSASWR